MSDHSSVTSPFSQQIKAAQASKTSFSSNEPEKLSFMDGELLEDRLSSKDPDYGSYDKQAELVTPACSLNSLPEFKHRKPFSAPFGGISLPEETVFGTNLLPDELNVAGYGENRGQRETLTPTPTPASSLATHTPHFMLATSPYCDFDLNINGSPAGGSPGRLSPH
jgi:hypothetical protein